jgi:tetratricopeptide (TPR) repeat protein
MPTLVALAVAPTFAQSTTPSDTLQEAIAEYRSALECTDRDERLQRFSRSEVLFAQVLYGGSDSGQDSQTGRYNAELFTNMGNAALGAERLGPAVIAFRQALALDPDHSRAQQNLEYARSLLPQWVPRPESTGLLDTFFSFATRLSRAERQLLAAAFFLGGAILLGVGIRWRRPVVRNLAFLPLAIWLCLLVALAIEARRGNGREAVVTVDEVVARSADSANSPARFRQPLPGGTEVQIAERREDWWRVRLADGRDAWLPKSSLTLIATPY